jgi:hypothetical protein
MTTIGERPKVKSLYQKITRFALSNGGTKSNGIRDNCCSVFLMIVCLLSDGWASNFITPGVLLVTVLSKHVFPDFCDSPISKSPIENTNASTTVII